MDKRALVEAEQPRSLPHYDADYPLARPQLCLRRGEAPAAPRPCILRGSVRGCFSPGVTCGRVVVVAAAAVLVLSFAHGGCVSRSLLSKGLARLLAARCTASAGAEGRSHREKEKLFFFQYRCKWV